MSEPDHDFGDDFYVGYLPEAPSGLARFVSRKVKLLLALALVVSVVIALAQKPFDVAAFDFGNPTKHAGWIQARPYPMLVVERPGRAGARAPRYSRYLLTAFGKFGAPDAVAALDGQYVELEGTLIYRDGETLLELVDGSIAEASAGSTPPDTSRPDESFGEHTLVGEIVDSKCFMGVMKPGNLKTHRACATRCISGGIPPVLLTRDEYGRPVYYVLADERGAPINARILDRIAETVEVRGEVVRYGELFVVRADPASVRRIEER